MFEVWQNLGKIFSYKKKITEDLINSSYILNIGINAV